VRPGETPQESGTGGSRGGSARRSRYVAAFLVVALVLVTAGCYRGNPTGPKVAIVGDSITRFVDPALDGTLDDRYQIDVRHHDGWRTVQLLPYLEDQLTTQPEAVIANLGTNDALQNYWGIDDWTNAWDELIADVADVPCVVLVNVSTSVELWQDGLLSAEPINARIEAEVAAHPNFRLVDWNAEVQAVGYGAVTIDAIHPNEAGVAWLANAYRSALDSCGSGQ
jgi:hypothetical protein